MGPSGEVPAGLQVHQNCSVVAGLVIGHATLSRGSTLPECRSEWGQEWRCEVSLCDSRNGATGGVITGGSGCSGECDVPDISTAAEIKCLNNMTVIDMLISTENDSLVWVEFGNPCEGIEKVIRSHDAAVHDQRAVRFYIYDHFADRTSMFLCFRCRWHLYIEFPFLSRKAPRQHKKAEQHEQDVNHRSNEKAPGFGLGARAKIHG